MIASSRKMVEELGITHRLLEADVFAGRIELLEGDAAAAERALRGAYDGLRDLGLGIDAARAARAARRARCSRRAASPRRRRSRHESEALAGDDLQAAIAWRGVRAEALARRGEHAAAVELAQAAVAIAAATDALLDHADARLALAAALRAAGRGARGRRRGARARSSSGRRRARRCSPSARSATRDAPCRSPALRRVRGAEGGTSRRCGRTRRPRRLLRSTPRSHAETSKRSRSCSATPTKSSITGPEPRGTARERSTRFAACCDRAIRSTPTGRSPRWAIRWCCSRGGWARPGPQEVASTSGSTGAKRSASSRPTRVGCICWQETFAADRLGDAVVRLYERYAEPLPEGPVRNQVTGTLALMRAVLGRLDFDRLAAILGPHVAFADHRRLGLPSSQGREAYLQSLRVLFDCSEDVSNRLDDILALGPSAFVFSLTNHGTDRVSGGTFERPLIFLARAGPDGLASHWEFFDSGCEAEALARFDELVGGVPPARAVHRRVRPNAASAVGHRFESAVAARDFAAAEACFDAGYREIDHSTGSEWGRDAAFASLQRLFRSRGSELRDRAARDARRAPVPQPPPHALERRHARPLRRRPVRARGDPARRDGRARPRRSPGDVRRRPPRRRDRAPLRALCRAAARRSGARARRPGRALARRVERADRSRPPRSHVAFVLSTRGSPGPGHLDRGQPRRVPCAHPPSARARARLRRAVRRRLRSRCRCAGLLDDASSAPRATVAARSRTGCASSTGSEPTAASRRSSASKRSRPSMRSRASTS